MIVISQDGTKRVESEKICVSEEGSIEVVYGKDRNNEEFARYKYFHNAIYAFVEFYRAANRGDGEFRFPEEEECW